LNSIDAPETKTLPSIGLANGILVAHSLNKNTS
jgi:hypothetical protein